MKHVQMREAKARLSELVAEVEKGEPVTITRHGQPVAVVVPIEDGKRLYPGDNQQPRKSLIDLLREFPGDDPVFERDHTPPREIDL
jgi:prevent-host-death family protein